MTDKGNYQVKLKYVLKILGEVKSLGSSSSASHLGTLASLVVYRNNLPLVP